MIIAYRTFTSSTAYAQISGLRMSSLQPTSNPFVETLVFLGESEYAQKVAPPPPRKFSRAQIASKMAVLALRAEKENKSHLEDLLRPDLKVSFSRSGENATVELSHKNKSDSWRVVSRCAFKI